MMHRVDVVIPSYKPGAEMEVLLKRLLEQTLLPEKILIINTEKAYWDPALEKLSDRIHVTHIAKEDFDHGGSRDQMIRLCEADLVLCMTQDAMPKDSFLVERLAESIEGNIKAAYGRQLPAEDCGYIEGHIRGFNYPEVSRVKSKGDLCELGIKTFFCSNVCAVYDRRTYLDLGGFVKKTIFNEDMIYAAGLIRAGYSIAYIAEARVIHSHNYSGIRYLHRNFDLGVSQAEHPEVFQDVPAEGEGLRLVKETLLWLLPRRPWLIPQLVWQSGMKYLGFRLGKSYKKMPLWLVKRLSDSPGWF